MFVNKFGSALGAEVTEADLTGDQDTQDIANIEIAFAEHLVLVFRDQKFSSPDEFVKAARILGDPMPPVTDTYRLPGYEVIEELKNNSVDKRTGKPIDQRGGSWHTDHSNLKHPPKATTLFAITLPPSGGANTEFTNMYLAYETLPDDVKKQISGRKSFQAYQSRRAPRKLLTRSNTERKDSSGVWQPIVRKHPVSEKPALYINPMRCDAVEGMDEKEGDDLLDYLYQHCNNPQFQYSHDWRPGDMLIWDNRCALHQATPLANPNETRYMHRIMLKGEQPVMAAMQQT